MEEKFNVAEILRNCPKGMELDCAMFNNAYLERVDENVEYPIVIKVGKTDVQRLTKEGCWNKYSNAKCVIFPKGKTTWEGFQRPFKDGDVVSYLDAISIFKEWGDNTLFRTYVTVYLNVDSIIDVAIPLFGKSIRKEARLATEEEKQKLFDTIKENGYKWNSETKTLEKIEPKFKDGDIITDSLGTCIFKGEGEGDFEGYVNFYCGISNGRFCVKDEKRNPNGHYGLIVNYRQSTEEEKEKLFQAIKDNGYRWNSETKTLEKLPKFKVGDWVVNIDEKVNQVVAIDDDGFTLDDGSHCNNAWNKLYRLWTIQDAKEGDVLTDHCDDYKNPLIFILKKFGKVNFGFVLKSDYSSYCFLTVGNKPRFKEGHFHHKHDIKPATKEQRDVLFQKMKESGYEWDAEKKELRKIEWKSAWGEEDEMMLEGAIDKISDLGTGEMVKDWLKSLKYRIQPKVELTQLDKNILEAAIAFVVQNNHFNCWRGVDKHTVLSALHSLRPQKQWKPSEEQIEALERMLNFAHFDEVNNRDIVRNLLSQLKKLREE